MCMLNARLGRAGQGSHGKRGRVFAQRICVCCELLTRGLLAAGLLVETYIESPAFPSYCALSSLRPCLNS